MSILSCTLQDMCEKIKSSGSHNIHRVVYFEPFAAAALFLRITLGAALSKERRLLGTDMLRILCQVALLLLVGI